MSDKKPEPEDEDRFETAVLCPVCGVEIDRIKHPKEELNSMVAPLVSGNRRKKHGEESPACAQHQDWTHGWTLKPIKRPETQPPTTFTTLVLCPVCRTPMDTITHAVDKPLAEIHAGISDDVRKKHAVKSPDCAKNALWADGWILRTTPDADPPKPEPACAKCGTTIRLAPREQMHLDAKGRPICYLCRLANAKDGEFVPAPTCLKCGRPMMKSRNDPVNGMLWYCDRCYNAQTRPTNPTGWECPRCKGIHAPWVLRCDCKSDYDPVCPVCNKSHPPRRPGDFPTCYPIQL